MRTYFLDAVYYVIVVLCCLVFFLQWLVKRAIETREEMGDQIRAFSVSQFNKHHQTPEVGCIEYRSDDVTNFFLLCLRYEYHISLGHDEKTSTAQIWWKSVHGGPRYGLMNT